MLSQLGTEGYKKKRGLSELYNFPTGVQPVGRLDEESEGLLLMTSDTALSVQIRSKTVEKTYLVQVDGQITEEALQQLQAGISITKDKAPYTTLPCRAMRVGDEQPVHPRNPPTRAGRHRPGSWIELVLTEGKFRQVRKMTAAVGFPTLRLIRTRIGGISLDHLAPGEVQEITGEEMPGREHTI
jgi:23S rRNA pseudouridine2457 synthase